MSSIDIKVGSNHPINNFICYDNESIPLNVKKVSFVTEIKES